MPRKRGGRFELESADTIADVRERRRAGRNPSSRGDLESLGKGEFRRVRARPWEKPPREGSSANLAKAAMKIH